MGIPVLKDICGCMSLKTGCLIIGIMGIISSVLAVFACLIMSLIMFVIGSIISHASQSSNQQSNIWTSPEIAVDDGSGFDGFNLDWGNSKKTRDALNDVAEATATIAIISMIMYAIISLGTMISSSCLVHGARKGTPGLLTPFLIWAPLVLILWLVLIIVPSVMLGSVKFGNFLPSLLWLGVVGFFWVVVYSHKKELSNPNYPHTDYARAGNTDGAVHYNVQQPGVQYNVPTQGVQYNVQQPGVQYNAPPQYNMPPQGVQYNAPPQYNMPPQGVQYNAPPQGGHYKA